MGYSQYDSRLFFSYLPSMRKAIILLFSAMFMNLDVHAQDETLAVKAIIQQLFDGMRNADSISIASVFAPNAIMQTIVVDKDGNTSVRQDKVANFVSFVGKQAKGAADEQITFETIKIDGALAIVWTPYRFVYNGQFSHCGVNSFTLVKLPDGWKINYLIDTRRKSGCD
ncbi:MAG: hypothetical protein RLZZ557_117 [Bacteroidota bacterium]|jgi:Putative lumazine-binding